jgi:hypothetical protein
MPLVQDEDSERGAGKELSKSQLKRLKHQNAYFTVPEVHACPRCGDMAPSCPNDVGRMFDYGTHTDCPACNKMSVVMIDGIVPCDDESHTDLNINHITGLPTVEYY